MDIILILLYTIGGFLLVFFGAFFLQISWKLLTASKSDFDLAREHSPEKIRQVFAGEANAYRNTTRDYAIAAGMAIDVKSGQLKPQGKVSREILEPLL